MAKRRSTEAKKNDKLLNVITMIGTIGVTLVLLVVMILHMPIIAYRTETNTGLETEQISISKYFKVWRPMIQQDGVLEKPAADDTKLLNIKAEIVEADEPKDDGLRLNQLIEGQYTLLFLGMDESGTLSDVNWVFQFDIFAGTMNILQIPRDCYMPDYGNSATNKLNSVYGSGKDTSVTPIQRVVNAIQENFGFVFDAYVKLNCNDIANIIDSIGGVPIHLPEEIMYEADKVLKAGDQILDGKQSEWFVRFRREYDEGDIGRVKAQRIFLAAAMQKLISMNQTEIFSAMQKIYKNQWISTDLSMEQISMLADFASERLTLDSVNVFMVPGEGYNNYGQSVYSIHKKVAIDLVNAYFRPYQNQIYPEESTIVELVPEGSYISIYDDTQESLDDIRNGDTSDGVQNAYSKKNT